MSGPTLITERLTLRPWRESDRHAFHALNSDPETMATIGPVMSRAESDAFMNRINQHFSDHGYGLWCVDCAGVVLGFTGLAHPWFREGLEIGWRLRSEFWGKGYATEAASEVLRFAFEDLGLDEIISFTAVTNRKSRAVMERIGLVHDPDQDFDHPSLLLGDPLREHVLYRLSAERYGEVS